MSANSRMNDRWDDAAINRLLDAVRNGCCDHDCPECNPPKRPPMRSANNNTAAIVIAVLMLIIAIGVILS